MLVVGFYRQVRIRQRLRFEMYFYETQPALSSLVGLHFSDGGILKKRMIGIVILGKERGLTLWMTCACAGVCHILVFFGQLEFFGHKAFFCLGLCHVLLIEFRESGRATARTQYQILVNLLSKALQLMEFLPPLGDGTTLVELFHLACG